MRRCFLVWTITFINTLLLGCQKQTTDGNVASFSVDGIQWPGNRASVCFMTPGFNVFKKTLQWTVEETFGKLTKLKFSGFGDCIQESPHIANIRILLAPEKNSDSMCIGNSGWSKIGMLASNPEIPKTSPTMCFSSLTILQVHNLVANGFSTIVHEFGHAAGLLHEFERKDAKLICPESWSPTAEDDTDLTEVFEIKALTGYKAKIMKVGPPDYFSVMNYCNMELLGSNGYISNLSSFDLQMLGKLYGSKDLPKRNIPTFIKTQKTPNEAEWLLESPRLEVTVKVRNTLSKSQNDAEIINLQTNLDATSVQVLETQKKNQHRLRTQ